MNSLKYLLIVSFLGALFSCQKEEIETESQALDSSGESLVWKVTNIRRIDVRFDTESNEFFEYDSEGKLTSYQNVTPSFTHSNGDYNYDESGNLISYKRDGYLVKQTFDQNDNLIERISNSKSQVQTEKWSYDESNREIGYSNDLSAFDFFTTREDYAYDEHNNLLSFTETRSDGNVLRTQVTDYVGKDLPKKSVQRLQDWSTGSFSDNESVLEWTYNDEMQEISFVMSINGEYYNHNCRHDMRYDENGNLIFYKTGFPGGDVITEVYLTYTSFPNQD